MEIELLRHLNTQKYFVLLDDSRIDRLKVINPAGTKLVMPADQFEDEPEYFSISEAKDKITELQYKLVVEELAKEEMQAQQFIAHAAKAAEHAAAEKKKAQMPAAPRTRRPRKPVNNKKGLGATWSSSSLTFYRHHIDPLGPKQSFRVIVDSIGVIEMTREDFQSVFNDVVMSSKYRQEGYFSFVDLPEKARRFIKSENKE